MVLGSIAQDNGKMNGDCHVLARGETNEEEAEEVSEVPRRHLSSVMLIFFVLPVGRHLNVRQS